ncbi:MAG: hypothetical protein J0L86_02665 [Flavobacteriales bacterium]|nr:hypothetical protein [Flavobacteriales bacterium]
MENNIENLEALGERLKKCYAFLHKDDKNKLGHLYSTNKSETNPYFKALSIDLKDRFGDEASGFSTSTIRDIYNLTYNAKKRDTLINLELFCKEIEDEIEKEKQQVQEKTTESPQFDQGIEDRKFVISSFLNIKDGNFFEKYRTLIAYFFASFSVPILFIFLIYFANQDNIVALGVLLQLLWIISAIVTIFGIYYTIKYAKTTKVIVGRLIVYFIGILISVLMILYIIVGTNYIVDELGDIPNESPIQSSPFVYDPARLGLGNTSISHYDGVADSLDELDVKNMIDGDTLDFFVYIDYQNASNKTLKNTKTSIKFPKKGNSSKASIFGMLFTSNEQEFLTDQTYLVNLPNSWSLTLVNARCTNTHPQKDCPGYAYDVPLKLEDLNSDNGASLPYLDNYGYSKTNGFTGACSQGHVIVQFQLINTTSRE